MKELETAEEDVQRSKNRNALKYARFRGFCKRLLETDEQRAERLKKKRELISLKENISLEKEKMSQSWRTDRSDTEKVKRRMIRTIGRLLNEKKPEDELWEYMAKEFGKKSRVLWDRMRFLTLKKLKMLFDADDEINNVPKVARMTLTDWLIFDLVLVHEKFDVIDMGKVRSEKPSKVLSKLFSLVQRFEIEGKVGEELTNAWIAATVHYNATGHQCSPMLLQRRWYQLKEVTRAMFYKFWFIFRGSKRQLAKAKDQSPISLLQRDVALRYSHIITEPFKHWEDCIKDRTVIMPEEFEMKMRSVNLMRPTDLTVPDVVLIEPKVNTIDLCDSDDEITTDKDKQTDDQSEPKTTEPSVTIKNEPIDLDDDADETEVPTETQTDSNFDEEIQRLQLVSNEISIGSDDEGQYDDERDSDGHSNDDDPNSALRKAVESINGAAKDIADVNMSLEESQIVEENPSTHASTSQDNVNNLDNNDVSPNFNAESHQNVQNDININEDIDHTLAENIGEPDLVVKVEKDAIVTDATEDVLPIISTITSVGVPIDLEVTENEPPNLENLIDNDDISSKKIDKSVAIQVKQEYQITNIDNDITEAINPQAISEHCKDNEYQNDNPDIQIKKEQADNIEDLASNEVENQIENTEQDASQNNQKQAVETENNEDSSSEEDIIKIVSQKQDDIIKLVSPSAKKVNEFNFNDVPMDLDFADDGIQLVDEGIEYVESDDDGENQESKEKEPKIDAKLLMCPVVYTAKIDKMAIFKYIPFSEQIQDKTVIDQIAFLSKPVSKLALLAEIEILNAKEECRKVKIVPANQITSIPALQNEELIIKSELEETALIQEETVETSEDEEVPRIKPTSYLLRKPNNRSYNPIQLCKNPDFNTRLKRIPVSFYTYPRNRILLNECKPMTIDVSKAFESKLFNGTLYLTSDKIVPCATPLQLSNDITAASIVPSAPPVQSLMDVDKILEEELKKRVVERNRSINLPDITEVRRINQQLLTAEVMPLRKLPGKETTDIVIDNSVVSANPIVSDNSSVYDNPSVSVNSTASDNPTVSTNSIVGDNPTVSTNSTVCDNPTVSVNSTVCDNSTVTDNTIVIDADPSPESQIGTQFNTNNENANDDTVTPVPNLEPIVPQKNSAKTKPPIKTTVDERDNTNTNKNDQSLNQARKNYRKNLQPVPSWLTKPNYVVDDSDVLLTTDTLYKMLFAIDPEAIYKSSFNRYVNETLKNNVVFEKQTIFKKKVRKSREDNIDQEEFTKQNDSKSQLNPEGGKEATYVKAKVNVVYHRSKSVQTRKKYCCWARNKIEYLIGNINRIRKHTPCGKVCKCCCAEALASHLASENEKIEKHKEQLRKEQERRQQEDEILKKACESIESVVQRSKDIRKAGVYTVNTAPVEPVQKLTATIPDPANKDALVYLEPNNTQIKEVVSETPVQMNYEKPQPSILQKLVEARSKTSELNTNTPINKNFSQKGLQWTTCPCNRPILKQSDHGTILVDGTSSCKFHNKNKKELEADKKGKLYINRKSTFDRPIFIGKNKLLLTNVKQPGQQIVLEKPPLVSAVPAAENLQMPEGVQIILLPNGTLTYTVDPNAQLTENQLAVMPTILAAIQLQINAGNLSVFPAAPVVDTVQNDIIGFQETSNYNLNNTVEPPIIETIDLDENEPSDSIPTTSQVSGTEEIKDATINTAPKEAKPTEEMSPKANDIIVSEETAQIDEVMEVDNDDSKKLNTETSEGLVPGKENTETENNTVVVQDTEGKPSDDKQTSQLDRKSLLSDLMEMSGICEEDVAPPIVPTPILEDPEQHLTKTTIFSIRPNLPAIAPKPSKKLFKDVYSDLSTVNSFSELKYAYQNKGLFFKLDLDTGVVVPITLCIKKKSRNIAPAISESVIDLTDDADIPDDENITFNTNSTDTPHNIKATHKDVFKRVLNEVQSSASIRQYSRSSATTKHARPNILVRKSNKTQNQSLLKYYILPPDKKSKSTQPTQIDLDDSDSPMVEEYLDPSSDESDDEPLAKKARRQAETRETSSHIEINLSSLDSTCNIEIEGEVALESTVNEETMPPELAQPAEEIQSSIPKPTHLVLTRDEVHETVPIGTFFQNEGEDTDSQDDCILGV